MVKNLFLGGNPICVLTGKHYDDVEDSGQKKQCNGVIHLGDPMLPKTTKKEEYQFDMLE